MPGVTHSFQEAFPEATRILSCKKPALKLTAGISVIILT